MNNQLNNGAFPILSSGTVKELEYKIQNIGKPSIFIGSSREALDVAKKVQRSFPEDQFQVDIWSDGIFGRTRSSGGDMPNMEWLKNFTDIYDFAIFIFVPDDRIVSYTRHNTDDGKVIEADGVRHNVVFEFGMFLGRIGAKKSFILFDEKVTSFVDLFFTDLKENLDDGVAVADVSSDFRIELKHYKGNYEAYTRDKKNVLPYDEISIDRAIAEMAEQIIKTFKEVEINFLPATTLAIGYFKNFLKIFVRNVNILKGSEAYPNNWQEQGINIDKLDGYRTTLQNCKTIKLKVVIPTSIEGSNQRNFTPDFKKDKFLPIHFPGENRSLTFLRKKGADDKDDEWIIYDVPTTLNSSIEAIDLLTNHNDIRELLKEKELRNFRKLLDFKADNAHEDESVANFREHVEFISYEQFKEETK